MAYQYGRSLPKVIPAITIENEAIRTREQILSNVEDIRHQVDKAKVRVKSLESKLETCRKDQDRVSAQLAEERARVNETKALIRDAERQTREAIEKAQREAILILATAERQCAVIRETAHQQARALHENAHKDGLKRGREYAIARTAALRNHEGRI